MPRIQVKPNQMIELVLDPKHDYEFLCNSIDEGVVVLFLSKETGRMVIAHCLPGLKSVFSFLLRIGSMQAMEEKNYEYLLICGARPEAALFDALTAQLKIQEVVFKVTGDCANAHVKVNPDRSLTLVNATPAFDFIDYSINGLDDIKDYLEDFCQIDSGTSFKESCRQSMVQTYNRSDNTESLDFNELDEMMMQYDAVFAEFDDPKGSRLTDKAKNAIALISDNVTYRAIYSVNIWQTVVVNIAQGRKVKLKSANGSVGLAVCDENSGILAVCLLGADANEATVRMAVERCWSTVQTKVMQKLKSVADLTLVYQIICQGSSPPATMMKAEIKAKVQKPGQRAREGTSGITAKLQYCPFEICMMELADGKFRIIEHTGKNGPAYQAPVSSLTESRYGQIKQLDRQAPDYVKFNDFLAVKDENIVVELTEACLFDVDMTKKKCVLQLKEKHVVLVAFCEHVNRAVLFQVPTDEFNKFIVNDELTEGNFAMMNMMTNFPLKADAKPVRLTLLCRESKIGHSKDSEACNAYVKKFRKNYDIYYEGARKVFANRVGAKANDQFELHPLAEPFVKTYKDGDISKHMLFELKGSELGFTVMSTSELGKSDFVLVRRPPKLVRAFYSELGVKAVDNYRIDTLVSARKKR